MILGFAIHNYNDLREIYSNNQTDAGLLLIGNYLKQSFPGMYAFYLTAGRFVLMGKDIFSIEDIRQKIETRFKSPWNAGKAVDMYLDVSFTQIKPEAFFCNRDLVLTTLLSNLIEAGNQEHKNIMAIDDDMNEIIKISKVN